MVFISLFISIDCGNMGGGCTENYQLEYQATDRSAINLNLEFGAAIRRIMGSYVRKRFASFLIHFPPENGNSELRFIQTVINKSIFRITRPFCAVVAPNKDDQRADKVDHKSGRSIVHLAGQFPLSATMAAPQSPKRPQKTRH